MPLLADNNSRTLVWNLHTLIVADCHSLRWSKTMQQNVIKTYKDYILVRIDEKSNLQVWVKLPPTGK